MVIGPCRNLVILGWASEAGDFPDENSLPWVSFPRRILFPVACLSQGTVLLAPPRQGEQGQGGLPASGGDPEGSRDKPCFLIRTLQEHSTGLQGHRKLHILAKLLLLQLCKALWLHLPPLCVVSHFLWSGAPPKTQSSQGIGPVFFKLAISEARPSFSG